MAFLHGINATLVDDGLRPLALTSTSVIGVIGTAPDADAAIFPVNTPVLVSGPRGAAALDTVGTNAGTLSGALAAIFLQAAAQVVVVRVEAGASDADTFTNLQGDSAAGTGVHAFTAANSLVGVTPKILTAPGWTHQRPGSPTPGPNPLIPVLVSVATGLRSIVVADGPDTNAVDAIAHAADSASDRLYMVDPFVTVAVGTTLEARPASGFVAGVIARTDAESGPSQSPSNRPILGISGIQRPVAFNINDSGNEAGNLNENGVATIVRLDGWKLWGNFSTATGSTQAFLSVRRQLDQILDVLEAAHVWAVDRPISTQLLKDIEQNAQNGLRNLQRQGATLAARVYLDAELNTPASLQAGQAWWNVNVEPPAPLQSLRFQVRRTPEAYEELLQITA